MNQDFKDFFSTEKNSVIPAEVSNDSKQIVNTIKDMHNGKRGMDLVMTDSGEMLAVPSTVVDNRKDLTKASTIAQGIFFYETIDLFKSESVTGISRL